MVDPIDRAAPEPHRSRSHEEYVVEGKELILEVTTMPANHMLQVEWWVFLEADAPRSRSAIAVRGPGARPAVDADPVELAPIEAKPNQWSKGKRTSTSSASSAAPSRLAATGWSAASPTRPSCGGPSSVGAEGRPWPPPERGLVGSGAGRVSAGEPRTAGLPPLGARRSLQPRTLRNAFWGMSTLPTCRIRRLPAFCFSSSLRFRVMSPP